MNEAKLHRPANAATGLVVDPFMDDISSRLGAWRNGWARGPFAGILGQSRAEISVVVCPSEIWESGLRGDDPERLLRTVLASILAANSGVSDLGMVIRRRGPGGMPEIEALHLSSDVRVRDLAACWTPLTTEEGSSRAAGLRELRTLLVAAELPWVELSDGGEALEDVLTERSCLLDCLMKVSDVGVEWTLGAPRDLADESLLRGLANQGATAIRILLNKPDVTVRELNQTMAPLYFDVHVVAGSAFAQITAALRAWGDAVSLPVIVHEAELGDEPARDVLPDSLPPPRWGANLLVASPALEMAAFERPPRETPTLGDGADWGRLPHGGVIAEINANETRELYDEIVVRNRYLRHGVQIYDGDRVVDVGANIGVFALFAASQARDVRVYSFEPVPVIAEALKANIDLYGTGATVFAEAVGGAGGRRTITFYPGSSLQSGFHADAARDKGIVLDYARRQAEEHPSVTPDLAEEMGDALLETVGDRVVGCRPYEVPVVSLSDWISRHGGERINLLKVDVERSEEEVLAGITEDHWALIDQVVVEVHDLDRRVARIDARLRHLGFLTVVEQDPLFAGSEVFMIYARRLDGRRHDPPWLSRQIAAAARWAETSSLPVVVTTLPGTVDTEALRVRDAALARGLTWVAPPGPRESATAGNSAEARDRLMLAWGEVLLQRLSEGERPVTKAIIVDCDNTIWGGVCGEVGAEGLDVGEPYRGVQEYLRAQTEVGRALCLCSRNNLEDVEAVFAAHPEMPLQLSDFTTVRVGWGTKSSAVSAISDELGFAVESLVFIDDSPAERMEVARRHPELAVVELPNDPSCFLATLQAAWCLRSDVTVTPEDRLRAKFLAAKVRQRSAVAVDEVCVTGTLQDQLGLDVDVSVARDIDVERISQLAARTTQFNLMLRRHTSGSVRQLISSGMVVLAVRVRDRFMEHGLVGFVSADPEEGVLRVRDFFLSCRVLGRNVEWRMLRSLGEWAMEEGFKAIELRVRPGPRNRPAVEFARKARSCLAMSGSLVGDGWLDAAAASTLDWQRVELGEEVAVDAGVAGPPSVPRFRWPVSTRAAELAAAEYAERRAEATVENSPYVAAETDIERQVAEVWEETLKVRPIGVYDDLFALGCDSLTATAICARMRRRGLKVTLPELLQHPTIRGIAERVGASAELPAVPFAANSDVQVASHGQQRIWAAEMIGGRGNAQIIPLAYRIHGPLNVGQLRSALATVIGRHPALRTVLAVSDGRLQQRHAPLTDVRLPVVDLGSSLASVGEGNLERVAADFFATTFDLGKDLMLRAVVLRAGPTDHTLLIAVHHSAADGWSIEILKRDISAAYQDLDALPVGESRPTFAHYSALVAERGLRGDFDESLREIWAALGAISSTGSALEGRSVRPGHLRFSLASSLIQKVHAVARNRAVTPVAVYLAAFQVLLAATARVDALVTGCPVANRHDPAFSDTVGFFANVVAIPVSIDWSAKLGAHLDMAARTTTTVLGYADVPLGLVTAARDRSTDGSLFDTMFTLQPPPIHPLSFPGCVVREVEPPAWPLPYPLMLDVQEFSDGGNALLRFEANPKSLWPADRIADAYPLVLAAFCALPEVRLRELRGLITPGGAEASNLIRDRLRDLATREGGHVGRNWRLP